MKRVRISGITGQDGSFLAEYLFSNGDGVHSIVGYASIFNTDRIDPIYTDPQERGVSLFRLYGDVTDGIYNLAAQSYVRASFDQAGYTADVAAAGTLRLLGAVRDYAESGKQVRYHQSGSSEMSGSADPPQSEPAPRVASARRNVRDLENHTRAHPYRAASLSGRLRGGHGRISLRVRIPRSRKTYCGLGWKPYVETDPRALFAPGFLPKASRKSGRKPRVTFEEMVRIVVEHDFDRARQERTLAAAGHKVIQRGLWHG
jgi:GDP-D-mannose dehydratase